MTVYVDDMYRTKMGRLGRMKMSHMIADTEQELHDMADHIGLNRKWYQGDHYDVCMSMRQKAIDAGAVPVTLRELSVMCMLRRKNGTMPSLDDARAWLEQRRRAIQTSLATTKQKKD